MELIPYVLIAPGLIFIGLNLLDKFTIPLSVKELYDKRRDNRKGIRFLLIAGYAAFFEYIFTLLNGMISLPHGKISDGYLLTLLGPFILVWWIIWGAITCFIVTPILGSLWIPVLLYTVIFELPASYLNSTNEIYPPLTNTQKGWESCIKIIKELEDKNT